MITHSGQTYKVVVCTPAGREKYLSFFKKFVYRKMEEGLIDGWQLWQNTVKQSDIDYLTSMAAENPKVKVFTVPDIEDKYNFCDTLRTYEFFANAQADDTIYVRFDDDIVWVEEGALEKMLKARIDCPYAFLIYPNIINSTTVTSWHQEIGALGLEAGEVNKENDVNPDNAYLHPFNYTDSGLIDLIHDTFKKRYNEKSLPAYYLPNRSLDKYNRFSICCIVWWGKDHIIPGRIEEPQLAYELPEKYHRPVFFVGDALMVHYAYHTQRDYLESCTPEKLEFYKSITY